MLEAIAACHRRGASAAYFTDFRYAARSWQGFTRRVVAKAEVVRLDERAPRSNPRFVVTNLRHTPERVYAIYCARGEIENRIKELKHDLALDRTSCHAFAANQLRLLLTTAAFAQVRGWAEWPALMQRRPTVTLCLRRDTGGGPPSPRSSRPGTRPAPRGTPAAVLPFPSLRRIILPSICDRPGVSFREGPTRA